MTRIHIQKGVFLFLILLVSWGYALAQKTITGSVVDDLGQPLIGVSVLVEGTTTGTVTDIDGKYTMHANEGDVLEFSYIGFVSQKATVGSENTIDVQLKPDVAELSEVIVIGYGVQKKIDKTGAVSHVKAEELNGGVLTDPIQGLQGKSAGVWISKKGGDPNSGFSVKIRGQSGFSSGTDPLYVVDGIPGIDPTTIAPEDIESFNVLKDASATAIYGSRGSNGVVMITTKKGSVTKGTQVEFNTNLAFEQVASTLDMLSGDEVRQFASDNGLNINDGGASTNWQDEIYRNALSQSHNFAVSGGNEATQYRASVTHQDNEGIVKGSEKQRTVGRINLTSKAIDDRLTIQANIAGTIERNDYVKYDGDGNNDVIYQALQRNPTDPVYTEEGAFYETQRDFNYYNPVALIEQIQDEREAKRYSGNLRLDFEILKGLKFATNLGYIRDDDENFYFEPSYVRGSTSTGMGRREYDNKESKILETYLTYDNEIFEGHNISLVGGYSWQEDINDGFKVEGRSPQSDYVKSHNITALTDITTDDISSYKNSNRLISFFGRAVYNYNSKYFLTGTIRRDGSTKFGSNNKWGLFPSGSIAWNISNEDFLQSISVINQLKIRVGYGITGNQEIDAYQSLPYYKIEGGGFDPETGESARLFSLGHNSNPDIKWEENSELNIGLDFAVLQNRISGSIEYYYKKTYDLLASYRVSVPPNLTENTWANVGAVDNEGIETTLLAHAVNQSNLSWKTSLVFSHNSMKVVKLSGDGYEWAENDKKRGWLSGRGLVGDQNYTQYINEGWGLGTFYLPEYAGLSSDGAILMYTESGGYTRNVEDAERRVLGSALPDFEIGWSNYFTIYKNLDASFSFRFVYGNMVLNNTRMVFENPTLLPNLNTTASALDEWERGLREAPKVNSYYLEDGSFVRLDDVTIGYSFRVSEISWLTKFRVYITGNNLLLITGYSGLDPESAYDGLEFGIDKYNVYPKTKSFTFGLNVTF